jgi:hypothetical protein
MSLNWLSQFRGQLQFDPKAYPLFGDVPEREMKEQAEPEKAL